MTNAEQIRVLRVTEGLRAEATELREKLEAMQVERDKWQSHHHAIQKELEVIMASSSQAESTLAAIRAAVEWHLEWLSSFSMPPTSTIAEKQEAMERLERALLDAAKKEGVLT